MHLACVDLFVLYLSFSNMSPLTILHDSICLDSHLQNSIFRCEVAINPAVFDEICRSSLLIYSEHIIRSRWFHFAIHCLCVTQLPLPFYYANWLHHSCQCYKHFLLWLVVSMGYFVCLAFLPPYSVNSNLIHLGILNTTLWFRVALKKQTKGNPIPWSQCLVQDGSKT